MHYIPVLCCVPCKSDLSVCVLCSILIAGVKNFNTKKIYRKNCPEEGHFSSSFLGETLGKADYSTCAFCDLIEEQLLEA